MPLEEIGSNWKGLLISLGLALVAVVLARLLHFFRFPVRTMRWSGENPVRGGQVIWAYALFFGTTVALVALLAPAIPLFLSFDESFQAVDDQARNFSRWLMLIAGLASALVLALYFSRLPSKTKKAILGWPWKIKDFGVGLLTYLLAMPLAAFAGNLLSWLLQFVMPSPKEEQAAVEIIRAAHGDTPLFVSMGLFVVIVVPFMEELLFRGFLQTYLRRYLKPIPALLLVGLLFTLFHFTLSQGWRNLEILLTLFVLGSFMGFLMERQQSLLAPYGLHVAVNGIALLFLTLEG